MQSRPRETEARVCDFVLRQPPVWTWVLFPLILASLHYCNAIATFRQGRIEGYLSLMLGTVLTAAAIVVWRTRSTVAVLSSQRRVKLCTRFLALKYERSICFDNVRAVRLKLESENNHRNSRMEIVCDECDIECPPGADLRQQALVLAIAMGVELVHVHGPVPVSAAGRRARRPAPGSAPPMASPGDIEQAS